MWKDLRGARESYRFFRFSEDDQERRIANVDEDFYRRKLAEYACSH